MTIKIQTQHQSQNFRSRAGTPVKFLVLHYTAVPLNTTLGIFTNNVEMAEPDRKYFLDRPDGLTLESLCRAEVSAHYVLSESGEIYNLVDETHAAYHAGVSVWDGVKNLNNHSIGIEHVNLGFQWLEPFPIERGVQCEGSEKLWLSYAPEQIQASIELCRDIIARHNILPHHVVGHSDIACGRKTDPGPLFPWEQFAQAGIGLWYDLKESTWNAESDLSDAVSWMQARLLEYGYDCPQSGILDDQTHAVIQAFQMHFRPSNISGDLDLECLQILESLCYRKAQIQEDCDPVFGPEELERSERSRIKI